MNPRWKLAVHRIAALGLIVVGLDVALSLTLLRDGRLGRRPLPPFGALTDPAQVEALERIERDQPSPLAVTSFDRELGWCVRPLAAHQNGDYHVNSRGLRGTRDYSAEPASGVLRLACFGDSFTFGDEVKDEWTYESMLEVEDPSIEALNFGVPAYGTDQALMRFRREGRWNARVVVLGLLLENVGRNVNRYRTLWYPRSQAPMSKPRFVLDARGELELVEQPFEDARALAKAVRDGSVTEKLAEHEYWIDRPRVVTGRWSSFGRLIAGFFAYRERNPKRLWLDRDGEPRRVTLAIVEAFHREALSSGASGFVVLVFPMRKELEEYEATGREYWSGLLADLDARGIDAIDLAPLLSAEQFRVRDEPEQLRIYSASHFSSFGNLIVAKALASWPRERFARR